MILGLFSVSAEPAEASLEDLKTELLQIMEELGNTPFEKRGQSREGSLRTHV